MNIHVTEQIKLDKIVHSLQEHDKNLSIITQQKTDQLIHELYEALIITAWQKNASDIHLEAQKNKGIIRIRIDSVCQYLCELPKNSHQQLLSKIKILSNLDIAQTLLPQDGKINLSITEKLITEQSIPNNQLQLRTSICPTIHGEKAVLRLLVSQKKLLKIEQLAMPKELEIAFINSISSPQGLILITGPTGSGKTVTLYTALNYLNTHKKNIMTIEDPVEIQLPGINQTSINTKSGFSYEIALRAFLRQDPDIIMIGEIRDKQTAEIAIQAAHTGHLVFATLHTNSCLDVITRLSQFDINYVSLISALKLIISQRLLRIFNKNKNHIKADEDKYQGRVAIFEGLYFDETLTAKALSNTNFFHHHNIANIPNFCSLRTRAEEYIAQNTTDIDEVNRVLGINTNELQA